MSDVALTYLNGIIDLDFGDGGTAIDDGMRTAVIISLFSDRLAEADDDLPDGGQGRRGWWGDIYPQVEEDLIGSRLWLLSRSKQMASVLRRAETYAREALQWMLDDGVATLVEVAAENPIDGLLALSVRIRSASGAEVVYRAIVGASGSPVSAILDESGDAILDESGAAITEES
jgi:phage gp46-like protein